MGSIRIIIKLHQKIRNILCDQVIKKLFKTSGIILAGNTGASVLNFCSFTLLVNQLGAQLFAYFTLAQTYILIVNGLLNIQTWESVVKFGHAEIHGGKLKSIIKLNFVLDLSSAILAFLCSILMLDFLIGLFNWDISIKEYILIYSLTIPFNLTTFKIGIPRLFDKFAIVASSQIYIAIIKFIMILTASYSKFNIKNYIYIYTIIEILGSVILIIWSLKILNENNHNGWWKHKLKVDWSQLKFIWWTNLRTIMRIPVQYCDMLIISLVMPIQTVGIYKVYKEFANILGKISDPVNQAIFPEYSKLIGNKDSKAAISLAKKTIMMLFSLSFILTLFMILFSKIFIAKFYGPEFLVSINALYLLIILFGVSFFTLPVNSLFLAAGFAKLSFYIVIVTNILYLLVSIILGKLIGMYGVIAAYGLQMMLNQGFKIILLKKYRYGWDSIIR